MKIAYSVAALLCFIPFTATAQERCAPRESIADQLADKYGEVQRTIMLTAPGSVMEFWTNEDTGTWTLMINRPDGLACLLADGAAFTDVEIPPEGVEG